MLSWIKILFDKSRHGFVGICSTNTGEQPWQHGSRNPMALSVSASQLEEREDLNVLALIFCHEDLIHLQIISSNSLPSSCFPTNTSNRQDYN